MPVDALYDTDASMNFMAKRFFVPCNMKYKLISCNWSIAGVGGEILRLVGECFVHFQIGYRVFRD